MLLRSRSSRPVPVLMESLEGRRLLAAHIVGSTAVYSTIQAAVDAASAGSTINVDPGAYAELVTVYKRLTINGAQAGVDARSNSRLTLGSESAINGIYNPSTTLHTSSFYIDANDVTIDGFTVKDNTNAGTYGAGIVIAPGMSGTHIVNNVIESNIAGLYLANASSTDPAVIQHNLFRWNNNAGDNGGRGIYTDGGVSGGNLTNVLIDSNTFFSNTGSTGTTGLEAAIAFESYTANSQSNIRITNNVFDSNGKAVLFFNATNILLQNNTVTWCWDRWSGAFRFEGGVSNVTITGNTLYDNPGAAIRIDDKGYPANNSNFTVTGNNFYGNSSFDGTKDALIVSAGQYDGTLNATNNWWGSSSGPSGDGAGGGDAVVSNGNSITFAPWSTSPAATRQLPYYGLPADVTAPIEAENYDHGGEGVAYHDTTPWNDGSTYRPGVSIFPWYFTTQWRIGESVDVYYSTNTSQDFYVGSTAAGEWLAYSVNVASAGTYRLDFRAANGQSNAGTFHVECDGQNVSGPITVPVTGGPDTWQTFSQAGISLPAGRHVLKMVFDSVGSSGYVANLDWFKFTNTDPVAAPSDLQAAAVSSSQINLSWTDNSNNETGFKIDRSTDGASFATIAVTAANTTTYSDVGLAPGTTYYYRVRATSATGDSGNSNVVSATTSLPVTYLSDLTWASATVGWGTIGKDVSIKGNPLTLAGVVYPKGIGTHAVSDILYNLNGHYGSFLSEIGIDDEVLGRGSVDFQVLADGSLIYDSGIVLGTTTPKAINLNVSGVNQLTLHVGDAGDGIDYDHADWAGARLLGPAGPTTPAAPAGLNASLAAANQITLNWTDNSSNESGFKIERSSSGSAGPWAPLAAVGPNVTTYTDSGLQAGTTYSYRVYAYNTAGSSGYSNIASASTPAPAAVSFVRSDSATEGSWSGVYGADGYWVFQSTSALPAYARVLPSNALNYVWMSPTSDGRGMQTATGSATRIAACLYAWTTFSLDVNLTDGKAHQVAIYMLDWDTTGRAQTVTMLDAASGATLDTRNVSGFHMGQWLVWNVSGHLTINVTLTGGIDSVASGIMFDPVGAQPATASAAASFVRSDTATAGTWSGAYGADGYQLFNSASALPAYAQLTPSNQQSYTWAASTPDARALQTPDLSSRVAACLYSATTFSLDVNLTDGKTHQIAIYMVDWDTTGRSQTVTVSDASSGATLDTRGVSNFHNGQWLVWNITGHVRITFTCTGGLNCVASGIMFDPIT